ncbi:sensor domain-containing protein [Streptomyces viridiviolaceus]
MKRARSTAASALILVSLAALTACGGDADSDAKADRPQASASTAKEVTPGQRLAGLMVTAADVEGFTVQEQDDEFLFAESAEEVRIDEQLCAPLAYAMNQLPLGDPVAGLTRVLSEDAKGPSSAHTYVTLTTYASDSAAKSAVADVKKAVRSCGNGFTAEASGGTSTYDSVTAEKVTPAGDDSLGFSATMTFRGASHTLHTEVVRSGDVVGVYFSVNGMAIANARPSEAELPAAVVEVQNAKLKS